MMTHEAVIIWVIYDHPIDYPTGYIARKFLNDKPTAEVLTADGIHEMRQKIPKGFVRIDRHPTDDSSIVESWL